MAEQRPMERVMAELLEMQARMEQMFVEARHSIVTVDEELRRQQAEAARAHIKFYTEQEAADYLRISLDTLQRERRARRVPYRRIRGVYLYTNEDLACIAETYAHPVRESKKKSSLSKVA